MKDLEIFEFRLVLMNGYYEHNLLLKLFAIPTKAGDLE